MPIQYPSLKTFDFKPIEFTPIEYKPIESRANDFLKNSLEKRNASKKEANTQLDAIRTTIDRLRSTMSEDEETQQWLTNYGQERINAIQAEIDSGNTDTAIELAGKLGSSFINTQVQGRQQAYTNWKTTYDKLKQGVDSGVYTERALARWKRNNPVNYSPALDENGVERTDIIGTWSTPGSIETKMDWDTFVKNVAQGPTEERTHSGGHTSSDGSSVGASSRQYLTKDRLLSYFDELVKKPENYRRIESARDDDFDEYNELLEKEVLTDDEKNRKNELYKLLFNEGIKVPIEEYAKRQTLNMISSKAYDYKTNPHISDAQNKNITPTDISNLGNSLNAKRVGWDPIGSPVVQYNDKFYLYNSFAGEFIEYTGTINDFDYK